MALHVTMSDVNPNIYQKMKLCPSHRESRIEISKLKGNPSTHEVIAVFWVNNDDLLKAAKTLEAYNDN